MLLSSLWKVYAILYFLSVFHAKKVNKPMNQKESYEAQVSLLRLGSSVYLAVVTNNSAVNQPTWLLLVCFLKRN